MNIYFYVIQNFAPLIITNIQKNALNKDNLAKQINAPSMLRNVKISEGKHNILNNLLINIKNLDTKSSDANTCEAISALINNCLANIKTIRERESHFTEGYTETALRKLSHFVDELFKQVAQLNILDTAYNEEPINTFGYHLTTFYAQLICDEAYEGIVNKVVNNFTSIQRRIAQQKELVQNSIKECRVKISKIKLKLDDYEDETYNITADFIDKLQRKNIDLCNEYEISDVLNNLYTLFSRPKLNAIPSGGFYLGEKLVDAHEEIRNIQNRKKNVHHSSSIEEISEYEDVETEPQPYS